MTIDEAYKITKVNKESPFRIVSTADLTHWEQLLGIISNYLVGGTMDINEQEECLSLVESLSHDILSVKL